MTFFLYLILSTLKPLIAAIASGREDFNGHEGGGWKPNAKIDVNKVQLKGRENIPICYPVIKSKWNKKKLWDVQQNLFKSYTNINLKTKNNL